MQQSLTDTELYNVLDLPFWNKSWFARELYPDRKRSADYFYNRLHNKKFEFNELNKLNRIMKKIAETEI